MDILLHAPDDADATLRRLHDWLRRDTTIRRTAEIALRPAEPEPDSMGVSLEAIQLIVDTGFQLSSLAIALAAWTNAREPQSVVTIRIGRVSVTLSPDQLKDAEAVLGALERLEDAAPGGERGKDAAGG